MLEVMRTPPPTPDLATVLTTVYCTIDERYVARYGPRKPVRRGVKPQVSDSEVLTWMVLAQWDPRRGEARWMAYVAEHWGAYFPRVLSQSAYNRRARDLAPVLAALGPAVAEAVVAQWPGAHYEAVDGVAVPLARRCRGLKRKVWTVEQATVGRGGSDKNWFFGVRLVAPVHPCGVITGFVGAPADTGERWLLEGLLRWRCAPTAEGPTAQELATVLGPTHATGGLRRGPTGPLWGRPAVGVPPAGPTVADLGFQGRAWQGHWATHYQVTVLTKADLPASATRVQRRALCHTAARARQLVETAFSWLDHRFGLPFPRARTPTGLLARIGAKVAAFNLGVLLNTSLGLPPYAFATSSPFN